MGKKKILQFIHTQSGLEAGRVQGETFAGAAPYPKPNAQYRVAFLSPDISPVRVQGGQRLVARRSGRNSPI